MIAAGAIEAQKAAPLPFAVVTLPPALLREASSVVRVHDAVITFDRPDRYTYQVRRVVTILDPGGAGEAQLVVHSSSLQKITELSARLYDAAGKPGRRLQGPADWRDVSATSADTYLDDTRARVADARQPAYPYTIELAYEIESRNPLFLPDWQPQQDERQSVERASLRLRHPATQPVRWLAHHLPTGAARPDTLAAGLTDHRWKLASLPALPAEALAPPLAERAPAVWCAPTAFAVQGHAGEQATWAALGRWFYDLNAGRDELPAALRAEMAALRDSVADPRRRARRVYERVQRTTRYVSIQLGLGGWQTTPATDVARTGYGDCKALTTYTRALLGAAGLPAHQALVLAGDDAPDIHPEWVAPQFNHVILCVPLAAAGAASPDTLWLECTSATRPFNSLGDFTANRHVLLVTPAGGQLVRTPTLGARTTRRTRAVTLRLDARGSATATVRTTRTGPLGDDYARLLLLDGPAQRKAIEETLRLPTSFTLTRARLLALPGGPAGAVVRENLTLTLPAAAARAGARLLLPLNLLSRVTVTPSDSVRRAPLWLTDATLYADTVVVELPAGTRAEDLPAPLQLSGDFGSFSRRATLSTDGTRLTYLRTYQTATGEFPPASYIRYAEFRAQIARADRQQVSLLLPPGVITGP